MGASFNLRLIFRGTRDGMMNAKFHELCDNQGALLVIIKTSKDILIGGFCSISYKNSGGSNVDPKCVVFSFTRNKIYNRLNDKYNVEFNSGYSLLIGCNAIVINNNKLWG